MFIFAISVAATACLLALVLLTLGFARRLVLLVLGCIQRICIHRIIPLRAVLCVCNERELS